MKFAIVPIILLTVFYSFLNSADDPAKGHYQSALFFLQKNQPQQAIDDLNTILRSFPQSPYADDALLQLGKYYLESVYDPEQALNYFEQIKARYADSNSAPGAYYYLGRIQLMRRDPSALQEAYANFSRVTRVFPSSDWADDAMVGAGLALKRMGEFDKAHDEFSRIKVRFADSPLAVEALYEMAVCSLYGDHHIEAAVQFQQVIDRFPGTDYAKMALNMNTILYRLYIAPPMEKKTYGVDPSFRPLFTDLDEPSGIVSDSHNNLYVSDKGKKIVYVYSSEGKLLSSIQAASPYSVSISQDDQTIIANGSTVIVPGKDALSFPTAEGKGFLEEIVSAVQSESGQYFLVSKKTPGILVYSASRELIPSASFSKTIEFWKVAFNGRRQLHALEKDRKRILVFDPDSRLLFTIQSTGTQLDFNKIIDFALDRANHIYALADNPRGILIFSPSGKLLKFIASVKGGSPSFDDAKLIAVGTSGEIYVLDKDQKTILKLG